MSPIRKTNATPLQYVGFMTSLTCCIGRKHNMCDDDGVLLVSIINLCTDSSTSDELKVPTVIFQCINRTSSSQTSPCRTVCVKEGSS